MELRISTSGIKFSKKTMEHDNCRFNRLRLLLCMASFKPVISIGATEAQARATKYATKYAATVYQGNFAFKYYNKILKKTFFIHKMYKKTELYATDLL